MFIISDSVSEDDSVKLGSIVSGVIDSISPQAVIVRVKSKGLLKGTISAEHLADHHGMCFLPHECIVFCFYSSVSELHFVI